MRAPAPRNRLRRFAQSSKNVIARDVTRPCRRRSLNILRLTYFGAEVYFSKYRTRKTRVLDADFYNTFVGVMMQSCITQYLGPVG